MGILHVENLTFCYPNATKPVLESISFDIAEGEFVLLCGATGSGKSTLLRMLKRELTPKGHRSGEILLDREPLGALSDRDAAARVGFVMQHPEHQLVTDTVWHELAFGLENIGVPSSVMVRRVAEIASYFGIGDIFERAVCELSGGQKQLVCLAAVLAMDPRVLILDEPTAQLDPIAAAEFVATLKKINRELGLTVILTEHRTEDVIPVADRVMILENGWLSVDAPPREAVRAVGTSLLPFMPCGVRLYHALGETGDCPVDVAAARAMICSHYDNAVRCLEHEPLSETAPTALRFKRVSFRYDRHAPDTLCDLDLTVREGEIMAVLGGNGAGKSTALSVAAGLLAPYSGHVEVFGRKLKSYKDHSLYRSCLAMLPQDVQTVFLKHTVRQELADAEDAARMLPIDLTPLYDRHPYDLSGGEQQLVALAKVLACRPRLLLLDEPTKGIDAAAKITLIDVLRELKKRGVTMVVVTHDVEFAASLADRCALFFRGAVVCAQDTASFFDGNRFYTTAVNRMTKGYYDRAITLEDAVSLCRRNGPKKDGDGA